MDQAAAPVTSVTAPDERPLSVTQPIETACSPRTSSSRSSTWASDQDSSKVAGEPLDAVVSSVDRVLQDRAYGHQLDLGIEQLDLRLELARVVHVDKPARERLDVHRLQYRATWGAHPRLASPEISWR